MKTKKIFFKGIICILAVIVLITEFSEIKVQILSTLKIWAEILIPSLFPYLVLSKYISSSNFFSIFKPLNIIIGKLFKISPAGVGVYLCSLFCGYPSGAVCTSDIYKNKLCTKNEAQRLICFTNNPGPLFLISVVGAGMLGCMRDGIALYVIQVISSFFLALLIRGKTENINNSSRIAKIPPKSLNTCIEEVIETMLIIGAQMIVWSTLAKVIILIVSYFRPLYDDSNIHCIIFSLFELSGATNLLSDIGSTPTGFAIICSLCSWGGLSVLMQIKSVIPKDFSFGKIVICKFLQSCISFCTAYIYKTYTSPGNINFEYQYPLKALLFVTVILLCIYIFTDMIKYFFKNTHKKAG